MKDCLAFRHSSLKEVLSLSFCTFRGFYMQIHISLKCICFQYVCRFYGRHGYRQTYCADFVYIYKAVHEIMKYTEVPNPRRSGACDCMHAEG